jgi:hypothetical protein
MTRARTSIARTPRKARLRPGLLAAAAAGTVLLAAACGGGSGSAPKASGSSPAQTTVQQVDAFSQCMRQHGEPNFSLSSQPNTNPDVLHFLGYTVEGVNPSSSQFTAATAACASLLPKMDVPAMTEAQLREMVRKDVNEAACMRTHGYPNFPDPTMRNGHPVLLPAPGTDTSSPQFLAAVSACA